MELLPKNLSASNRRLKIIHLNNDCLENVFSYLDLTDLTNIAESNVHLAVVATNIFAYRYHNQEILLKGQRNSQGYSAHKYSRIQFNEICMILKHFGKHITKLNIFCDQLSFSSKRVVDRIIDKLSEHCSSTLLELKLSQFSYGVHFKRTFTKLEKLVFYQCFWKFIKPMDNISTIFPNIRSIELHNVRYAFDSIVLEQHFPKLEHFGYYTFPYVAFIAQDLQSINRIVQLNPQLKSLGMYLSEMDWSHERMQPMNMLMVPLPGIEIIELWVTYPISIGPFHFANIKHLKIIGNHDLNSEWFEIAHQIEKLELSICTVTAHMTNFIVSCRNMKKLEIITSEQDLNMEYIQYIAKNLPLLDEVHISVYKHNKELKYSTALTAMIEFMRHCPQLTKAIVARDIGDRDEFRSRFKHNVHINSKQIIKSYRDTIKRSLSLSTLQWCIKHELKPAELIKGFEGYHRYLFFQVSFEKYRSFNA